jgi:GPH family glycoside/pentoside/hexuronide:cation symporter
MATALPFSLRFSFGLGSLGTATVLNSTSVLLLFFMTNLLGISPWIGGMLLFLSKVVDVISNPVIGSISDRTNTSLGRRRPYLLGGGIAMCLSFTALFAVPVFATEWLTVAYLLAVMTVLSLAYATFTVPYLAVAAEATQQYNERTTLMAFRVFFILLGSLIGTALAPAIATPSGVGTRGTFLSMGLILGTVILVSSLWCFRGTRSATFYEPDASSLGLAAQLRVALQNQPFVVLASAKLMQLIGVASVITCTLYLTRYVLLIDGRLAALFFLAMTLSSAISVPLWWLISRRSGKRAAYVSAVLLYALVSLTWLGAAPVSGPADLWLVYARGVLLGLGSGGLILMGVSMLPDTIEYARNLSGARREGVFTGLWSSVEKGATAVGGLLIGIILDVMGFVKSTGEVVTQPESALTGIIIGVSVLPALTMLASLPLLARYRLTKADLDRMQSASA